MKSKIIISILLSLNLTLFGQEIVFEKDLGMKTLNKESYSIVNYQKKEIVVLLFDNKELKGLRFNMNYEFLDEYSAEKPAYKRPLGYSIDEKGIHLMYSNGESNEFYSQCIDIVGKTSSDLKLLVTLKENEKYIETVSYNDKFYLLTCKIETSVLQIYAFEGNSLVTTKEMDLSSYDFSKKRKSDLYNALIDKSHLTDPEEIKIQKIDINNPNSIDIVISKNKIYYYKDKIFLSIDNELENTKLITIDLKDLSTKIDFFDQVNVDCEKAIIIQSNSYLYLDKLYQIKGCYIGLGFQVVNIEKDSIVKVFRIKEDEEININNTPLMLDDNKSGNLRQDTERELNSTKQLLKKMTDSKIGIIANLKNDEIIITIGGYTEMQNTMMTPERMYTISLYNDTRVVYFKSIFDSNDYKHIEGKVPNNSHDLINEFIVANANSGMKSLIIFRVINDYIVGYYNKLDKRYYLRKFTV